LPNLISVLRILLIVPIAVALAHDELLLTCALLGALVPVTVVISGLDYVLVFAQRAAAAR
jgi:hypothetical protein